MNTIIRLTAVLGLLAAAAPAAVYDFGKNGENKNNITWESRAAIETIIGTSVRCAGVARWQADAPEKSLIAVSVPVDSFRTGIELRDEHLRSADWLDAATYPRLTFKTTRIETLDAGKNLYRLIGELTCHGVTRERTLEATIKPMPAKAGYENYGYVGDILHVQARFSVKLADHNIDMSKRPALAGIKVAEEVTVTVDLFGFTNNKPQRPAEEVEKTVADLLG